MKYVFSALISSVLIFSCKDSVDASSIFLEPHAEMRSLLDSFVRINGQSYAEYAVYINRISPHEFEILIYAGDEPLTKNEDGLNSQKPLQKVRVSDIAFKLYSGMEHYFQNGQVDEKKTTPPSANDRKVFWVVKDSFNVRTVYETHYAYPFIALPAKLPEGGRFIQPGEDSAIR